MKRTIVVLLGFAALAAPLASAGGPARLSPTQGIIRQEDRSGYVAGPASTVALSPVERIIAQENARRNDPALLGSGPVPTTAVEVVESGGFHWGDAGIGAAVIVAATLVLAGTTLVVRNRRPSQA